MRRTAILDFGVSAMPGLVRPAYGYNYGMTLLRLRTGVALITSFFVLTVG